MLKGFAAGYFPSFLGLQNCFPYGKMPKRSSQEPFQGWEKQIQRQIKTHSSLCKTPSVLMTQILP